ncbi:hypothetical protein [Calothrix sp. NIES-2098]
MRKCAVDTPNLIVMDVLMPMMDGVEATRRIIVNRPLQLSW